MTYTITRNSKLQTEVKNTQHILSLLKIGGYESKTIWQQTPFHVIITVALPSEKSYNYQTNSFMH